MKSAPQYPLPLERATWQGEAVVAVVADSRAAAEDGVAALTVEFEPLPSPGRHGDGARPGAVVIHPELGDNLVFTRTAETGDVAAAFAAAHKVVEATFHTGRHTGVTLEPRSIIADYNRADGTLTVHHSTQAPHMMQNVFATQLRMAEATCASSARMSAAPTASRSTSIPTRWRWPACRGSWAGR
jgi:carbon-monoxide dehydrogenase large subunit